MSKPFRGVINVDTRDSTPDWEPYLQPVAPEGAPNVLYIVLDDIGFGQLGCYGSPIQTRFLGQLAHVVHERAARLGTTSSRRVRPTSRATALGLPRFRGHLPSLSRHDGGVHESQGNEARSADVHARVQGRGSAPRA